MSDKTTFESKGSQVIARHGCKTISMSVQEASEAMTNLQKTISDAENFEPLVSDLLLELNELFKTKFYIVQKKKSKEKIGKEKLDLEKAAMEYLIRYKDNFTSLCSIIGKISDHIDTDRYINIAKEIGEDKSKKETEKEKRYQHAVKEFDLLQTVFKELNIDYDLEYSKQPEDIEESIDVNVENHYNALNRFAKVKHKIKRRTLLAKQIRKLIKEYG